MRPSSFPLLGLVALCALSTCGADATTPDELPWLRDLIRRLEAEPARNPPAVIVEYDYKGELVYYLPPACCDIPSDLYDRKGALICHPDGGFTGHGDGRCPGFLTERSNARVIWCDARGDG